MRIITALFLLAFCWHFPAFAQCETEPAIETTGKVLKTEKFETPWLKFPAKQLMRATSASYPETENLGFLELKASASGSSWRQKGAEAAVLTVFVNGKYNQDIVLFAGAEPFTYRTALGNLGAGKQEVAIVLNEKRSSPTVRNVKIEGLQIKQAEIALRGAEKDIAAVSNAPFIYARQNAVDKFSDIPLLTYYETFDEPEGGFRIRYTTIFSHEDGGTQAAALMARWGRVTDIEWVYEATVKNGKVVSEIYQGANHETKPFNGKRVFGGHPLLFTVTDNNNFADAGCSALRFAPLPVRADLSNGSRETLMEKFPWTYRVMAEEVIREGRVNSEKLEANIIADPRDYLYVELNTELKNAAVAVETSGENGVKVASDAGSPLLRVNRNGFVRIALRLPQNFKQTFPDKISVRCHAVETTKGESGCQSLNVVKVVRLDKNFKPQEKQLRQPPKINIKPNQTADFVVE